MTPSITTEEAPTTEVPIRHRPGRRHRLARADWTPPARTSSQATNDTPPPPPPTDTDDDHGGGGGGGRDDKITVSLLPKTRRAIIGLGEITGDDNQTVVNRNLLMMWWAQQELGGESQFENAVELAVVVREALKAGQQILISASGAVIALDSDGSIRPLRTPSF